MNDYELAHLQLLRPRLGECTVLLKADGSFPLSEPCEIAAYGNGVRHTVKGGTGSGEVNSRFFITVEQGLRDAGFTVTTGTWLDRYDEIRKKAVDRFYAERRRTALLKEGPAAFASMGSVVPEPDYYLPLEGSGDTAIYVLSRICGEGSDRAAVKGDAYLSDTEIRDIRDLNRKYRRFMLILNVGAPVDLTPVNNVKNILLLSQLGVETGSVCAELLLGKQYPSGKLTSTWANLKEYCDCAEFGEKEDTRYYEGIYVGYRWFDTVGKTPLYPFGFGLGYTAFRVSQPVLTAAEETVTVTAELTNTGAHAGKETLQVYASAPQGRLGKPYQSLAGWAKTGELLPGEAQTLTVRFPLKSLASYDAEEGAWILEGGDYIIRAGVSSADTAVCGVIRLDETLPTAQAPAVLGDCGFEDLCPERAEAPALPDNVPVICLSVSDFLYAEEPASCAEPLNAEEFEAADDETLARLNIGGFPEKGGVTSVVGDNSVTVCGAAGETSARFKQFGIPVLPMADGPAGIRISKQYFTDEKGTHPIGSTLPESVSVLMPAFVRKLGTSKAPTGAEIREQYCTAIPIGTAIAQSWSCSFAELCGDVVGTEMERFEIPLWLAPALNIHRSPLCGRNFEYYSEDPLISGRFAAAVTRGVQKHPGCGVTIKHFAANNQEYNRYNSCSRVSERALREIYLKGFEICVREAQPCAVMTSYNLINGVHTSESKPLADLLREEFGFRGILMTDWVVVPGILSRGAKYAPPDPAKVAAAGCSLFMPGCEADLKAMLAGLQKGTVTRRQLCENAARTAALARYLRG